MKVVSFYELDLAYIGRDRYILIMGSYIFIKEVGLLLRLDVITGQLMMIGQTPECSDINLGSDWMHHYWIY